MYNPSIVNSLSEYSKLRLKRIHLILEYSFGKTCHEIFGPAGLNIVNDCHHYEPVVGLEYSTSPSYDIGEVGGTIVAD